MDRGTRSDREAGVRDLRIRMSRGQLRAAQYAQRIACRRSRSSEVAQLSTSAGLQACFPPYEEVRFMKRLIIVAAILFAASAASAAITEPVKLDSGMASGAAGNDAAVRVFKGIPF